MKPSIWPFSAPLAIRMGLSVMAIMALLVAGCSAKRAGEGAHYFRIPWQGSDGNYRLEDIELKTFNDPEGLSGELGTIYVDPLVTKSGLEGPRPIGRFLRTESGVWVPSDFITLQATAVYAHVERIHQLDALTAPPGLLRYPRSIGLGVLLKDAMGLLANNALYDGGMDVLMIVPYVNDELPITLNGGVLAHEHFHALFNALVLSQLKERQKSDLMNAADDWNLRAQVETLDAPEDLNAVFAAAATSISVEPIEDVSASEYNRFLLRSLNEGLADYWGWIYSGDTSFIVHSLKKARDERRLDQEFKRLPTISRLRTGLARMTGLGPQMRMSYVLGTQYARFMKALTIDAIGESSPSLEKRAAVGQALLNALPALAKEFAAKLDSDFVSPGVLLSPLVTSLGNSKTAACKIMKDFVSEDANANKDTKAACPGAVSDTPESGTSAPVPRRGEV